MANYVLAQSWARANTQDRLWYVETMEDFADFIENENVSFGDKAYIMSEAVFLICGSEGWYSMTDGTNITELLNNGTDEDGEIS